MIKVIQCSIPRFKNFTFSAFCKKTKISIKTLNGKLAAILGLMKVYLDCYLLEGSKTRQILIYSQN
ncbi:hypothetical protein GCM10007384_02110 [Aquimarina muelleri]|uniref:Uncharacterized protein n=1 Tax=Aquimarina muelleri TaxID=279356 RepID=A0A918N1N3_9FLAO|nr:hypothetical protein GCM10007384_02110 [Aquimarina muelleri]